MPGPPIVQDLAQVTSREGAEAPELRGYRPIRDYAAVGDCHGAALIARDGSIDWCCLRRHDADPVFCRLLDAAKGGYWSIRPAGRYEVSRAYLSETNILRTVFTTVTGRVVLTDFMPVGRQIGAGAHDYVSLNAPNWLVRRVEGSDGEVELEFAFRPSFDFARNRAVLTFGDGRLSGSGLPDLFADLPFLIDGDHARATVTVRTGERCDFVLAANTVEGEDPRDRVDEFLAVTEAFWREWIAYCRYAGPHRDAVRRSALALKLLTYAPTGALVAALTTSLPEEVGGERNWDYRYSWLRDSSFTLYALAVLGYAGEARCYHDYLAACFRRTLPMVQIMYGIERECDLTESVLNHLEGYESSRPVRAGNGAFNQRQIDVYGQVLDLALLYERLGGRLSEQYRRLLRTLAAFVAAHWRESDQGIWEMRGAPHHHVHGTLMSWVALDRASQVLREGTNWRAVADEVLSEVAAKGVDPEGGHLTQVFGSSQTDAALLLAPMLGLPMEHATLERTVAAVEQELRRGDFLLRYRSDDGLRGQEGEFLICSFWLVDALLATGRADEARALFDRLCGHANDIGLYAEEIDAESGAFLGNFPQAFTHLALIGSAVHLQLNDRYGAAGIAGSYADRAARSVGATFGWRGIWAAVKQCGRVGRIRASKRSYLVWP
jgi:alpha,alpha-trehalase